MTDESHTTPAGLTDHLRDPHLFGAAAEGIELLETHISYVVLAGELAWKFKKAVDLGFVNTVTLESRRVSCHEELRLNRRLAPDLYLRVDQLTGTWEQPEWNGPGEVLEYALLMRRFPQSALLPAVLERGELENRHIDALAQTAAHFHAQAEVATAESPWGQPAEVLHPALVNFDHIDFPGLVEQTQERRSALRDWTLAEHKRLTAFFAGRRRDGFVRECHGDMHLGNMFLEHDAIVVFDGIDFNPQLRWIDVLSEVAFLVMDLYDRRRPDLAHRFLDGYLSATGDYAGLASLRFYAVYRALVRAKVASLRAKQKSHEPAAVEKFAQEFLGYLALAEQWSQTPKLWLAFTHGVSGSGKTWVSQQLVDQRGAIRLRSDVERKRLLDLAPMARSNAAETAKLYCAEQTERTYQRLADLATQVLAAGLPVVIDATCLQQQQRQQFRELAHRLGVRSFLLDCSAQPELLAARVAQRHHADSDASDATLDVLQQQLRNDQPVRHDEADVVLQVTPEQPLNLTHFD